MGFKTKLAVFVLLFAVVYRMLSNKQQFNSNEIIGKRVLITGASSGIGEQLAYQYAHHGASVYITARREHLLQKVNDQCKRVGSPKAKFGYMAMDMMDLERTEELVTSAVSALGGLDVIILNHAFIPYLAKFSASAESFSRLHRSLTVNVMASAQISAHALPHLTETQGYIGVINSYCGKIAGALVSEYTSSKFALDGFFSSLRAEIGPLNISVTSFVIGSIDTDTAHEAIKDALDRGLFSKELVAGIQFASAVKTAKEIMQGMSFRLQEVYYPDNVKSIIMWHKLGSAYKLFLQLF